MALLASALVANRRRLTSSRLSVEKKLSAAALSYAVPTAPIDARIPASPMTRAFRHLTARGRLNRSLLGRETSLRRTGSPARGLLNDARDGIAGVGRRGKSRWDVELTGTPSMPHAISVRSLKGSISLRRLEC